MTTAAIYVRVSTEDQAKHGYSLGNQLEACRTKAIGLGARQVVEFADEGVSGALLQRPGLSALREALKAGSVDLVVVMDPDRLARNLSHQLLITEEIEKAKARLEFVNFEWRNTPEGQLFYAVRGAISQFEKEKIRERTSRGRQQKAKTGKLPLAFKPYGYDYDPDSSLLVVNQEEAQVVRDMFRWLLEEGEGPNGIARRLNQVGIPSKKGGQWHRNVVRQILLNPVYTGRFYANRYDTTGMGLNRHRGKEDRVAASLRPQEEWIAIEVPAIVEEPLFNQAQKLLERARRLWAGTPRAEYLLSGLVVCGHCQMSMSGHNAKEWGRKRRVYTCRRAYQGAPEGACNRKVDAASIERAVWDRILDWLNNPEELRSEIEQKTDTDALQRELADIRQGLGQITKGRANMIKILEQGAVTADAMMDSLNRLKEREHELQSRQTELKQILAQGNVTEQEMEAWRQTARQWLDRIDDAEPEERKQLVRTLVTRVTVHDGTLTVFARWPALFQNAPECNRERDPDAPAQPQAGAGGGLALRPDRRRSGG
ncbi:MAG: recombinase family protein [Bacillota bacterium]